MDQLATAHLNIDPSFFAPTQGPVDLSDESDWSSAGSGDEDSDDSEDLEDQLMKRPGREKKRRRRQSAAGQPKKKKQKKKYGCISLRSCSQEVQQLMARANALFIDGRFPQSREVLNALLCKQPDLIDAYVLLAEVFGRLGDRANQARVASVAARMSAPASLSLWKHAGALWAALENEMAGARRKMIHCYKKAFQCGGSADDDVLSLLANCMLEEGKRAEARRYLEALAEKYPEDLGHARTLARCLHGQTDYTGSAAVLEAALQNWKSQKEAEGGMMGVVGDVQIQVHPPPRQESGGGASASGVRHPSRGVSGGSAVGHPSRGVSEGSEVFPFRETSGAEAADEHLGSGNENEFALALPSGEGGVMEGSLPLDENAASCVNMLAEVLLDLRQWQRVREVIADFTMGATTDDLAWRFPDVLCKDMQAAAALGQKESVYQMHLASVEWAGRELVDLILAKADALEAVGLRAEATETLQKCLAPLLELQDKERGREHPPAASAAAAAASASAEEAAASLGGGGPLENISWSKYEATALLKYCKCLLGLGGQGDFETVQWICRRFLLTSFETFLRKQKAMKAEEKIRERQQQSGTEERERGISGGTEDALRDLLQLQVRECPFESPEDRLLLSDVLQAAGFREQSDRVVATMSLQEWRTSQRKPPAMSLHEREQLLSELLSEAAELIRLVEELPSADGRGGREEGDTEMGGTESGASSASASASSSSSSSASASAGGRSSRGRRSPLPPREVSKKGEREATEEEQQRKKKTSSWGQPICALTYRPLIFLGASPLVCVRGKYRFQISPALKARMMVFSRRFVGLVEECEKDVERVRKKKEEMLRHAKNQKVQRRVLRLAAGGGGGQHRSRERDRDKDPFRHLDEGNGRVGGGSEGDERERGDDSPEFRQKNVKQNAISKSLALKGITELLGGVQGTMSFLTKGTDIMRLAGDSAGALRVLELVQSGQKRAQDSMALRVHLNKKLPTIALEAGSVRAVVNRLRSNISSSASGQPQGGGQEDILGGAGAAVGRESGMQTPAESGASSIRETLRGDKEKGEKEKEKQGGVSSSSSSGGGPLLLSQLQLLCLFTFRGPSRPLLSQPALVNSQLLDFRNTTVRLFPIKPLSPHLALLGGHLAAMTGRWNLATSEYMLAHSLRPQCSLTALCLAVCFVCFATSRAVPGRHAALAQAAAVFSRYANLRTNEALQRANLASGARVEGEREREGRRRGWTQKEGETEKEKDPEGVSRWVKTLFDCEVAYNKARSALHHELLYLALPVFLCIQRSLEDMGPPPVAPPPAPVSSAPASGVAASALSYLESDRMQMLRSVGHNIAAIYRANADKEAAARASREAICWE
uniref:Tetratricopeptide repeat-containing protein n=1 Tax=Chromera velia CCMP2878 TaxID=1169474 RepID=A0A0G4GEV3_9ALVE|eukprot:Cvel_21553.t1-p1 / transcript=Cvel_21553.t1 / gene=Cvel_21553 / organism=Chromera_velia_CCMP2878 / gene_product=hypothetical protein / transcript_product=hypothetical protein / location=Cvel_scaffold2032:15357-28121(-) / protein_length=1350 / sequence_SO=supercontig / SO=protein_coding / is_pseudo=false